MYKKKRMTKLIITILSLTLIIILLILIFKTHAPRFSPENAYGNFEETVFLSESLNYVLTEDFDKYTLSATEEGINEYFASLYPSGAGISYVALDTKNENYSLRILDSYGSFHTLTIKKEAMNLTIEIDSFKKTYIIKSPDRGEED